MDKKQAPRSGILKWGLGGLGAVGVGLAACTLACSVVVPVLLVFGLGAATVSIVETGAVLAGKVLVVGGVLAIGLGVFQWWWGRRRSCGCDDAGSSPEPIACTLGGRGMLQRLDEFREVFERGYLGGERISGGVRWRFRAAPGLEMHLRDLAEREHSCCRFFKFDIRATGDEIWWDSHVDDAEAQPILDEFFALPRHLGKSNQRREGAAPG
jgi:hypothetical protein